MHASLCESVEINNRGKRMGLFKADMSAEFHKNKT
jgi:hypothetical protein